MLLPYVIAVSILPREILKTTIFYVYKRTLFAALLFCMCVDVGFYENRLASASHLSDNIFNSYSIKDT